MLFEKEISDPDPRIGYRIGWYAIKTAGRTDLPEAVDMKRPKPASWEACIKYAYLGRYVLCSEIDGWSMIASMSLIPYDMAYGFPIIVSHLRNLSRRYGNAACFVNDRTSDYFCVSHAENGVINDAYAYGGESEYENREYLSSELENRLISGRYRLNPEFARLPFAVSEKLIIDVAEEWSVSPIRFGPDANLRVMLMSKKCVLSEPA